MYLEKLMYENVGPINEVHLDLSFSENGSPKPILFVGENGSGKSTLISNIVDSFYEMAGVVFENATEAVEGGGHQYYKSISSVEINAGKQYMFSYIGYKDTKNFAYVLKCGNISIAELKSKIGTVESQKFNSEESVNYKAITIEHDDVRRIWENNVICYFGPDRYEKPVWMGKKYYKTEEFLHLTIKDRWSGYLYNPISVKDVTSANLQWLLDVIVDSRPDIDIKENRLEITHINTSTLIELRKARENLELIMSKIIGEEVYFGLNFRNNGISRFKILRKRDDSIIAPSLDSLSTGQIALFNLFSTIVRYADYNKIRQSINLSEITGIVVIDEIELHLHTKLQREVLPQLI